MPGWRLMFFTSRNNSLFKNSDKSSPFQDGFLPSSLSEQLSCFLQTHRTKQGEKKKTHTSKISSGGRKQMNQVIKTIAPLAPLCSWAQESLIGAVSAHRQVVLQSISCSKEHADSIRRPRAPPPRTDTAGWVQCLSGQGPTTNWCTRAVTPGLAICRWEACHLSKATPVDCYQQKALSVWKASRNFQW